MDYKKLTKIADGRDNVARLDSDLVYRWNEYCDATNNPDDMIYLMDEFDDLMSGKSPLEIATQCYYGNLNPNDDWFWFNGYGNFESSDYTENSPIDLDALEDWEGEMMRK